MGGGKGNGRREREWMAGKGGISSARRRDGTRMTGETLRMLTPRSISQLPQESSQHMLLRDDFDVSVGAGADTCACVCVCACVCACVCSCV
eukprot:2039758-Pleurochrysis_carterae.AAC.1